MSETVQKKFEEARDKLAASLKNLEEITIAKIHETSKNSRMMLNIAEGDESSLRAKLFEQSSIILNLSEELNKIQKTTSETDKENDFLKDKNRFFADKIFKFKTQGSNLIQAVESDLSRVKEIIKNQS
ncbi:MAG: hypothetical protein EXR06_03900 [Rickettsiales bacterium]|nr:hypothetical protein [Rickettsiales bacterium]